jgi:ATP-binding cassette subfamily C protein
MNPTSAPPLAGARLWRALWRTYREDDGGRWPAALPLCLLLAGICEGIGLTALLPLFIGLAGPGAPDSTIARAARTVLGHAGLQPDLPTLLTLVVAAVALKAGLLLLAMRQVAAIVARIGALFRAALVDALLQARWGYFVGQPAGRLASAIGGEAERAANVFLFAGTLLADALQAAVFLGFALLLSWRLTLAALAIGVVTMAVLSGLVRLSRSAGRRQTDQLWALTRRLVDSMVAMKPMKATGREQNLRPYLRQEIEQLRRSLRDFIFGTQANTILQEPILVLGVALVLGVSARWFGLPLPTLIAMGLLLYRSAARLGAVQRSYLRLVGSAGTLLLIDETIAEARAAREEQGGGRAPTLRRGIELAGVTLRLGSQTVLREVSLSLPAGTLTAITGPSGIGKTTLVDLLAGLCRPAAGEVRIDGVPLPELDLAAWRRRIGYVPQDMALLNDSILENVRLHDPDIGRTAVEAALETAALADFVAGLPEGLDTMVGERGARLSGGQRQRLALARALVHQPWLLILDEATTALDPATEAEVCRRLRQRLGPLTIVAVTHQPALVAAASQVIALSAAGAAHHSPPASSPSAGEAAVTRAAAEVLRASAP